MQSSPALQPKQAPQGDPKIRMLEKFRLLWYPPIPAFLFERRYDGSVDRWIDGKADAAGAALGDRLSVLVS